MEKQNEANGTASEPIARYDEPSVLQTYKLALENIVQIGGFWAVGHDKALYHIEMPDKAGECMWKNAKRYDMQTGKVMGYTNADRLRAMSDEELAEFMADNCGCPVDKCPHLDDEKDCGQCWADWLKQEAATWEH